MDKKAETPKFSASFSASVLHALEPVVLAQDVLRFQIGGIFVEPCAEGGVIVAATNGRVIAALRDAGGSCDVARRVTIPPHLFAAVTPPKPLAAVYEGDVIEHPAPDWMQPDKVILTHFGAMVFPAAHHPDDEPEHAHLLANAIAESGNIYRGEYRVHEDAKPVDWRRALVRAQRKPERVIGLDPRLLGLFGRICDLHLTTGNSIMLRAAGPDDPMLVHIENVTSFAGAIMPMRTKIVDFELPTWLAPKTAGAA